jgi:hydroxymethylpyrimidine/phosphomethylpyrimidine kinase
MALKILSVAGFDGSGGAGITSDVKIFSKFKILGLSAITALTAQNPDNIYKVEPVSDVLFYDELKAVFNYFSVDAVKTGLIFNENQSLILSRFIKKYGPGTVVVDPVHISTSKKRLTEESCFPEFLSPLFAYATVITPNIKEAELISDTEIKDLKGMKLAAKKIRKKYPGIKNIIVKGSHVSEKFRENKIFSVMLNSQGEYFVWEKRRLTFEKEIHGTGCAFSAYLTVMLANSLRIEEAVLETEKFVTKIINGLKKIPDNSSEKKIYITGNI